MLVAPRTFDVIVVGAGSAGCVVASRLAENSSRSVLLLEAGPDLRADPPDGLHDAWGMYREHGWGYESQPDAHGVVKPLHRGELLGGTAWVTRDAMRGSPADFEEWVRLGNIGWRFDDALPYFTRLENDLDLGTQPWQGSSGRCQSPVIPVLNRRSMKRPSFAPSPPTASRWWKITTVPVRWVSARCPGQHTTGPG